MLQVFMGKLIAMIAISTPIRQVHSLIALYLHNWKITPNINLLFLDIFHILDHIVLDHIVTLLRNMLLMNG
jgi:hypothetical protein